MVMNSVARLNVATQLSNIFCSMTVRTFIEPKAPALGRYTNIFAPVIMVISG